MSEATKPLVLVVEDEPQMRRFLRATLTSHGFRLLEAGTAADAFALASVHVPDVVLLDLGLPDLDGFEVTSRIRQWSSVPTIVLSARGREADKIEALDKGLATTSPSRSARVRRSVFRGNEEVHLTPLEYKLLADLVKNAGMVMTHRQLLHDVWGPQSGNQSHYLRVHMAQLRHKLEDEPARPRHLTTEPGVGYRLKTD